MIKNCIVKFLSFLRMYMGATEYLLEATYWSLSLSDLKLFLEKLFLEK